nr:protein FAM90A27P-like [Oryctolagus cuniculus]
MDPNTLSMEQGKELLKQWGIPQQDIDLMVEKWVVVASVEAMLRFPLKPGEDPTARCVSQGKCQLTVDQPQATSQRPDDPKDRKTNDQLKSKPDQKPKAMNQMARHSVCHQPRRPLKDNKPQRRSVCQRASPPDGEYSKVKCKNCGAFGHLAKSKRCPMKSWGRAIPLLALGGNQEKENLKPKKPDGLQPAESLRKTERQEAGTHSETPYRSRCATEAPNKTPQLSTDGPAQGSGVNFADSPHHVLKKFTPGPAGSAKPTAKGPDVSSRDTLQPARKTPTLGHRSNPQAQIKVAEGDSKLPPQPVTENCVQNSKLSTQAPGKRSAQDSIQTSQNRPKKSRLLVSQPLSSTSGPAHSRAPQGSTKTPVLKPISDPQPPSNSRCSSSGQNFPIFQPRVSSRVPDTTQRIGPKKQDSARSRTPPASNPGKSTTAHQNTHVLKESERQGPQVTRSVLYEDLLVSSSSDDSD